MSGALRLCGTVIWLFTVSQIAAQTRPKHENPSEFTRVSNGPTRSQEQKNQKPRGSQSKLAFAWEEIFECNLHVAGSRPEATVQGFAFELWGNRDIAEHSCWGKAYLCCCLSCCRCWQEAGGGPGWDRGWWVHEGAGVYTVLCSVKPVHHFIGNHCSESLDAHIETPTWEWKSLLPLWTQMVQWSDRSEDLSHSPGGFKVLVGLDSEICGGKNSKHSLVAFITSRTVYQWPTPVTSTFACPLGSNLPIGTLVGRVGVPFSLGISWYQSTNPPNAHNKWWIMHYFHPKLPSWKQNLWMFHSLWLSNLKF